MHFAGVFFPKMHLPLYLTIYIIQAKVSLILHGCIIIR